MQFLDSFFKLTENKTSVKTEILAGLTTFLAMAYIIVVNPTLLHDAGMNYEAVFVATCLSAALGTAIMGLLANYPIALAPGMGLNGYFTYTVVKGMGLSWEIALGAVFFSGVLFILVTLTKLREILVNAIPRSIKFSIAAGLGLFLALLGMKSAGLVVSHPQTFVTLGDLHRPTVLLSALGFFLIFTLEHRKIPGSVIIGILLITILGSLLGLNPAHFSSISDFIAPIPSLAPTFMKMDLKGAMSAGLIGIIFVFFLVDLFDTTGTLMGVAHRAKLLDQEGNLPRLNKALMADTFAIVVGAALGTSSTTAYVESAAGTAVGGRTGLTALVVALLFIVTLWFSPLASAVPSYATAPALCYIAVLMLHGLTEIDWDDITEAAPAALTAFTMPFTFSIADGIAFGFISYVCIKLLTGRWKQLTPAVIIIAALWVVKFSFFH